MEKKKYTRYDAIVLAESALKGDSEARNDLIYLFQPEIKKYMDSIYVETTNREELEQDAMVYIIEQIYSMIQAKDSRLADYDFFDELLYATYIHIKSYANSLEENPVVAIKNSEIAVEDVNFDAILEKTSFLSMLSSLETVERRIFILMMKGLSYEEIANIAEISVTELENHIDIIKDKAKRNFFAENSQKDAQKELR